MTLFNRYYELKNNDAHNNIIFKDVDVFFIGNINEERSNYIISKAWKYYEKAIYSINYDIENEKYSIKKILKESDLVSKNVVNKDLINSFIDELSTIDLNDKNILIDITAIKHPLLFYFLLALKKEFKPKSLLLTYTEPEKYLKEEKDKDFLQKFDLTEKFCEVGSIPGFARVSNYNKEKLLVAIMGFEGNRFSKAITEVNPSYRNTYAFVGFPSFQPSWQYYVYSQNQYQLEQTKAYNLIKRATANEPFGVYNNLYELKKNNPDVEIVIAPIGTKPHTLGVCMFAIDNEDVQLFYDFPSIGNKIRTEGIGKSYLYNLTHYINE